ncbi:hypothetical protein M988_0920 [Hafnia paralvei ATCC 29927]|nr:hypothetical protein RN38_17230 [Hafnia paralvei]OAT43624.1 hypothetical protein M988_0920 [Hafnia paralvei ATCC 29927]
MTTLSSDIVRRIEDAAAALIGGGSLSNISPVMRAFRACQRELAVLRVVVAEPDRLLQDTKIQATRRCMSICCHSRLTMFERRSPVDSANLTTDFNDMSHKSSKFRQ